MILGIGIDTVQIPRIEKLYKKFEYRFLIKIFTENEIKKFDSIEDLSKKTSYLAKRFGAKEAFGKALGLGIGRGINFKDIEVLNDKMGKPYIKLSKSIIDFLKNYYTIDKEEIIIHTSLSDDYPIAQAFVIMEKIVK